MPCFLQARQTGNMLKIGSHVSMSGKDMFLNSVREAAGYGAHTFMLYTGAPQNTRRKPVEELNIDAGWEAMHQYGMEEFVVHAPYIINLANTVKPETFQLAVDFLTLEVQRTAAMKSPASGSTCRCRCGSRNSSDHQRIK